MSRIQTVGLMVAVVLIVHVLFVQGAKMGYWSTDTMGRIRAA